MQNIIEHIARFADIDTRRAMGVKPGKLARTNLDIKFVPDGFWRMFGHDTRMYKFDKAQLFVSANLKTWIFTNESPFSIREYSYREPEKTFWQRLCTCLHDYA